MTTRSAGRALETGCWALGLVLIALYSGARAYGEIERRQAVATFTQARLPPEQTESSTGRVRASATPTSEPTESAQLPAALLRIRRIGLEVPIFGDTSERNLNRGAGLVAGTAPLASDGNIAIAAHRDGYFRALELVVVGDVLELESLSQQRRYRVAELSVVEPTDISPLRETDSPAVTLVTCYPFYFVGAAPQRYIVRAVAMD